MPKRVKFNVIYATSEVADHPASELGWAGPASRGWRSAPGARAPHEIVLQLETRVAITRVQLLAHQYLIPKRIELLIHDSSGNDNAPRTPSSPQYEAIGWVGLAEANINGENNDGENSAAARELRTASIPRRPARYLRLRLMEAHPNEKNKFIQVALMGVNIFGFEISADCDVSDADIQKLGDQIGTDTEIYSPYDDLAFIMYVDSDIADFIRKLEVKKQAAILAERFEYARKLKSACNVLSSGGRVLGGLQLQKRIAAAAEQYERATRRRDAIIAGRARLAAAINLDNLLEANGPCPQNDEYLVEENPFSLEMLTQPTTNSSFDAPSPPTLSQNQSLRDSILNYKSIGHYENDNNYQSLPCNVNENHYPEGLLLKQIKRNSLIAEAGILSQSSSRERLHTPDNLSKSEASYLYKRIDSPSCNPIKGVQFNNIDNAKHVAYFDDNCDRMSQNSVEIEESCIRNPKHLIVSSTPKDKVDFINNGPHLMGIRDESYFNSPANSVSPTNLQIISNAEALRNGQGSPATSSRSSIQQKVVTNNESTNVVVKRRNRSAGPPIPAHHRSSYEAYEERMVPALRHSHTNEFLRGYQEPEQHKVRPKIGERERKQAALPILIFGEELVEKFYSKHFTEKEEGLKNLKDGLLQFDEKPPTGTAALSPNKTARAATFLLHRALRDHVFSVYSLSAEVTRIFFTEFIPGRVNPAEITRCVERLVPELLTRSGDPAPRVHSLAMHTILSMADCPNVRSLNIIPPHLVRPLTAGTAPRLALSRLLMVEQLMLNHGIDKNSGLKTRAVAELGAGGLTHGQGAVRRAAERLLLAAYEKAPRIVRGQLPPDDSVTRRNLLYRHLFENFDRADKRKHEGITENNQFTQSTSEVQFSKSLDFISREASKSMCNSMTMSQMANSMATSQIGPSVSMSKSMTSSMYQPKSSLKKPSSKKYTTSVGFNGIKSDTEFPGYNKLRLDSAVSPKHQPKPSSTQQNPRNYVLEKNWQNSIMQNGNGYSSEENGIKLKRMGDESLSCSNKSSSDNLNQIVKTNNNSEPLHPFHKSGIVARNLHSSIVFDTGMYSDSEDTSCVENGIKKISVKSSSTRESTQGSPVASNNKSSKNIKNNIYRSKSGSNMATCFNDNFDSFDEGHLEIETYEYEKQNEYNEMKTVHGDHNDYTNSSTPEVIGRDDESQCAFCLQQISEVSLDIHYWRVCPLLIKCPACRTPLEIRVLSQHLTEECSQSSDYKMCPRCMEAIEIENFQRHIADDDCSEVCEGFWKCPLCHENVSSDEELWRSHLTGNADKPCVANMRIIRK